MQSWFFSVFRYQTACFDGSACWSNFDRRQDYFGLQQIFNWFRPRFLNIFFAFFLFQNTLILPKKTLDFWFNLPQKLQSSVQTLISKFFDVCDFRNHVDHFFLNSWNYSRAFAVHFLRKVSILNGFEAIENLLNSILIFSLRTDWFLACQAKTRHFFLFLKGRILRVWMEKNKFFFENVAW